MSGTPPVGVIGGTEAIAALREKVEVKDRQPQDGVVQMLESRITHGKLTPRQKDLARRLCATALARVDDARQIPKIVRGLLSLIEAWESVNREEPEKEDPRKVKHIADYMEDLQAGAQAGQEIAQAQDEAERFADELLATVRGEPAAAGEPAAPPRRRGLIDVIA